MWRASVAALAACIVLSGSAALAEPSIDVGTFTLLPNTANQPISLLVTGGDLVTGFDLRAQIGDGTGPGIEPTFQSVNNFSGGTIWDGHANTVVLQGAPSTIQDSVVLNAMGDSVSASGTLVNLTISTVGVSPGSYPFLLTGTQIGLPSEFIGGGLGDYVTTAVTNGTINVSSTPEPSTLLLVALGGAGILLRRGRSA